MILVKLGGSVITDKTQYKAFRKETMARLAREISESGARVILVHGAGSFGHVLAHQHRLQEGSVDDSQIPGLAKVAEDVRELDLKVIKELNEAGLNTISLPPSAIGRLRKGKLEKMDLSLFQKYLELGITPVTFGDVMLDEDRGFGICSGDQLMEALAKEFLPEKVIFVSDVDGIFTCDPNEDSKAQLIATVDRNVLKQLPKGNRCKDVTGSIFGKIESMLRLCSHGCQPIIINGHKEGRLAAALRGESVLGSMVRDD